MIEIIVHLLRMSQFANHMKINIIIYILSLAVIAVSCKKKGCTDPAATNYNVSAEKDDQSCEYATDYSSEFTFTHQVNGSSFLFDTIHYLHPGGQNYSIQTLKYFVSDIVLYKSSGDSIVLDVTHYVDAENTSTNSFSFESSIENGTYTGIGFVFGLDEGKNITGSLVNPPESLMEWPVPMGGGYHYMKMEGKYDSLGTIKNYAIHTGALMGTPYYVRYSQSQTFTVTNNELNVEFLMELNNLFQNPTLYNFDVFGSGIMGNQTAQETIHGNGHDVFSIGSIN